MHDPKWEDTDIKVKRTKHGHYLTELAPTQRSSCNPLSFLTLHGKQNTSLLEIKAKIMVETQNNAIKALHRRQACGASAEENALVTRMSVMPTRSPSLPWHLMSRVGRSQQHRDLQIGVETTSYDMVCAKKLASLVEFINSRNGFMTRPWGRYFTCHPCAERCSNWDEKRDRSRHCARILSLE